MRSNLMHLRSLPAGVKTIFRHTTGLALGRGIVRWAAAVRLATGYAGIRGARSLGRLRE